LGGVLKKGGSIAAKPFQLLGQGLKWGWGKVIPDLRKNRISDIKNVYKDN
jgi:hypothetical protein